MQLEAGRAHARVKTMPSRPTNGRPAHPHLAAVPTSQEEPAPARPSSPGPQVERPVSEARHAETSAGPEKKELSRSPQPIPRRARATTSVSSRSPQPALRAARMKTPAASDLVEVGRARLLDERPRVRLVEDNPPLPASSRRP